MFGCNIKWFLNMVVDSGICKLLCIISAGINLLPGVRINSVVLPLIRIDLPHSTCLRTSTSQWRGKFHNGLWLEKRPLFSAMWRAPGRHLTPFPEVPHKLQIIEGFFLMCCGKLLEMRLLNILVLAHIFRHVHVVLLTRAGFDLGSCFFLEQCPKISIALEPLLPDLSKIGQTKVLV